MARTLIGQLILRLRADGLDEARKVRTAMSDIEAAAKRLGGAGVNSWGVGFQRQLDRLKLTRDEIGQIERSWVAMHDSIKKRGLDKALGAAEISHWKTSTISAFAGVQGEWDRHLKSIESKTRRHATRMGDIMKPVFVGLGFYTAAYGAGLAGAGALRAASESTRTNYRMELANIPDEDQERMRAEAQRLSTKYGMIDEQDVLELNKTAWALFGGDTDAAIGLMETLIRNFVADVTAVGVDKAGENLSSFLKAMDNLNVNEGPDLGLEDIKAILEGATRAKQVEGKDIDIGEYLEFARRAKAGKYGLDDEFLEFYLPALGQDVGFSALGDALSGAFQNLVVPSGGGRQGLYVKRQKAMGLRDENNQLINSEEFGANPFEWTIQTLKPLLEENGVDTTSATQVNEAVKKLMSNSKASAVISGFILAEEQIRKNIDLYKGAAGTEDAENARYKDPFAAAESLLAALRNLSAALIPIETIAAGLNKLADGINNLAAVGEDHPWMTAMGMGTVGWATYAGGRSLASRMTDLFGLKSSAVALDGSAAALTRAAVALGGSSVTDVVDGPGGKSTKVGRIGVGGTFGIVSGLFAAAAAIKTIGDDLEVREPQPNTPGDYFNRIRDGSFDWRRFWLGEAAEPEFDARQHFGIDLRPDGEPETPTELPRISVSPDIDADGARTTAESVGADIESALNVTARPTVDTSSLQSALALTRRLQREITQLGGLATTSGTDVAAEMRRNFAD